MMSLKTLIEELAKIFKKNFVLKLSTSDEITVLSGTQIDLLATIP